MKRSTIALAVLSVAAIAQQPEPPILDAYRSWRANHPDLERDAAKGDSNLEARVQKSATDQAKFAALRKTSLEEMRDEARRQIAAVDQLEIRITPEQNTNATDSVVNTATAANGVARDAASGTDRGLRALRQALERERVALQAISDGIASRKKVDSDLTESSQTAELARDNVRQKYSAIATGFDQEAQQVAREQLAWTEYYRLLNPNARRGLTQSPPPSPTAVASAETRINAPRVNDPAPVVNATPSITPLPLIRYIGEWQYSKAVKVFQGLEPETAELTVHEDKGQVTGSLNVRFRTGPGERTVQFDFSGALQTTRNQTFLLRSSAGDKGAIELIPGTAFNLLQVKFGLDERPGKINSGDFVLLKK